MAAVNETQQSIDQFNRKTYASASKQTLSPKFPKRNQAIVIDTLEDFRVSDYVIAVGTIVGPKNVLSASKIANNRICIYLSSNQLVEQLVEINKTITVQDKEFRLRRYVTLAKRLLISNVCSSIPHALVENAVKSLGLSPVSPVTTLKVGIGIMNEAYSHVESFRRQMFVTPPQDNIILPNSTTVTYENISYRIFFCFDELTCFLCKQSGHTASRCPFSPEQPHSQSAINTTNDPVLKSHAERKPSTTCYDTQQTQKSNTHSIKDSQNIEPVPASTNHISTPSHSKK